MAGKPAKVDEFSRHEVLDRAYLAFEFFSERVAGHEALKAFPDLRREAETISSRLFELYQAIGARSLS